MDRLNAAAPIFLAPKTRAMQNSVKAHVRRLTSSLQQNVTVRILEPGQAICGVEELLHILGLPQLRNVNGMQLLLEALHLDTAKTNRKLALLGDLIQKTLLAQVALSAEWSLTPGFIQEAIFFKMIRNDHMRQRALHFNLSGPYDQEETLNACTLRAYMFRLPTGSDHDGEVQVKARRISDTVEALIGAVYLASGSSWQGNCLQVMERLGVGIIAARQEVRDCYKKQFDMIWQNLVRRQFWGYRE